MSLPLEHGTGDPEAQPWRQRVLPATVVLAALAFIAAPWPLSEKAHAALHGLCAQTPDHTFLVGGQPLPFDGRMTGIYLGALVTLVALLATGRGRSAGLPTRGAAAILLLMGGAMALDGLNSLLTDMGAWHPWQSGRVTRFATGFGAGIGIATLLVMLLAITLWERPDLRSRVVRHWWEPLVPVLVAVPIGWILIGGGYLGEAGYVIWTFVLMGSALAVLAGLMTVVVTMVRHRENLFRTFADIQPLLAAGVIAAIVVMALLAGGRFLVESVLATPVS